MEEKEHDSDFWVIEATLDVPVLFDIGTKSINSLFISISNEDPDGFFQLQPVDKDRISNSTFVSESKPIIYHCRGLFKASDHHFVLARGSELIERLADRLTMLFGYPVRVLNIEYVYDEAGLRRCLNNENKEYAIVTIGEESFRTQHPKNYSFQQLLFPPEEAIESIRWFRQGLIAKRKVDQYLYYFIALESIGKHIPGVTRGPRFNSNGDEDGLESKENAGIKFLFSRHPDYPPKLKKDITITRGRIAHGNTNDKTYEMVSKNITFLQRLVLDGISLVYGIDPQFLNILQPNPNVIESLFLSAEYSSKSNPIIKWGDLLSDVFMKYKYKFK